jgi:drug/metabolite transporter (DMT)-like permease
MMTSRASLIGFSAILMWALLAFLSAASGHVPPLQLAAMCFAIGGGLGAASWLFRAGAARRAFAEDWRVYAMGCAGLFTYHFFYFTAIRLAPALEVSLIAYLWPMLIIVFSAFLPGEKLRLHHVLGGLLGLGGAALILTGGKGVAFSPEYAAGYGAALLCALIWSGYSVLSRACRRASTDVITVFCLVSSVLALLAHLALERTVWPQVLPEWLAVVLLGVLPLGAAFYAWDYGVKHGDIQVLGAASYAAPLLSTLVLVAAGIGELSWVSAVACASITLGALWAARDLVLTQN